MTTNAEPHKLLKWKLNFEPSRSEVLVFCCVLLSLQKANIQLLDFNKQINFSKYNNKFPHKSKKSSNLFWNQTNQNAKGISLFIMNISCLIFFLQVALLHRHGKLENLLIFFPSFSLLHISITFSGSSGNANLMCF